MKRAWNMNGKEFRLTVDLGTWVLFHDYLKDNKLKLADHYPQYTREIRWWDQFYTARTFLIAALSKP